MLKLKINLIIPIINMFVYNRVGKEVSFYWKKKLSACADIKSGKVERGKKKYGEHSLFLFNRILPFYNKYNIAPLYQSQYLVKASLAGVKKLIFHASCCALNKSWSIVFVFFFSWKKKLLFPFHSFYTKNLN